MYDEAIRIDSKYAIAYYNKGELLFIIGNSLYQMK